MPFLDSNTLAAYVAENNFLIADPDIKGKDGLVKNVDDIIYQKTGIEPPATPDAAPGILRNTACVLFLNLSLMKRSGIDNDTRLHIEKLYNDEMEYLNAVENGQKKVMQDGKIVSRPPNVLTPSFIKGHRGCVV